ncbi:MAG: Na/Pi cotransporter family protein [Magnetococcales bacterium]|nr:Na/Pi cotransporter family protein [Magnetococcales bacterium]
MSNNPVSSLPLIISVLGNLAVFLYGMEVINQSLKIIIGKKVENLLDSLTQHRVLQPLAGLSIAASIQSAALTARMVMRFSSLGLLSVNEAIGVLLGVNLGIAITVQIIALELMEWAVVLFLLGFIPILFFRHRPRFRQIGHFFIGLGLIFFSMDQMANVVATWPDLNRITEITGYLESPWLGLLVGLILSALIQSSAAAMGLILVLAMGDLIPLHAGFYLALGTNLGSALNGMAFSYHRNTNERQLGLIHAFYNLFPVLLAVWWIPEIAHWFSIDEINTNVWHHGAVGSVSDFPHHIADFYFLIHLTSAIILLPFIGLLLRLLQHHWPSDPDPSLDPSLIDTQSAANRKVYSPQYLDNTFLSSPSLALSMVHREIRAMTKVLDEMITKAPKAVIEGDSTLMNSIRAQDDLVDAMHQAITQYLGRIRTRQLPTQTAKKVLATIAVSGALESIGDIIETNLSHLAEVCSGRKVRFTEAETQPVMELHAHVLEAFRSAVSAYVSHSRSKAEHVLMLDDQLRQIESNCRMEQWNTLHDNEEAFDSFHLTLLMDIRENLKRIHHHSRRIVDLVLDTNPTD